MLSNFSDKKTVGEKFDVKSALINVIKTVQKYSEKYPDIESLKTAFDKLNFETYTQGLKKVMLLEEGAIFSGK